MLPWKITALPDGSTMVLGLSPGHSVMGAAKARFSPPPPQAAMFEDPDGAITIEAYFSEVSLSQLTGKLILTLQAPAALVADFQERSERKPVGTGTFRYAIPQGHEGRLDKLPIRAITFAPTASLDRELVSTRFGAPAEEEALEGGAALWYPDVGLGVVINERGRDMIQYVHPDDFSWMQAEVRGGGLGAGE